MEAVERENYKWSALERAEILALAIAREQKVAVSESREIARIVYLGQITNIGSSRAQKLLMKHSRGCRDISVHDKLLEKGWRLRIAQNCKGSIFRSNNEYWRQSRTKIMKGLTP